MKMFLKVSKTYIFNFDINGHNLTYTGRVIAIDSNFVTFEDKYGYTFSYNLSTLKSVQEVKE